MVNLINAVESIPSSAYLTLGGAAIVSLVLQGVKHYVKLTNDKIINILLASFSFLAAGFNYLIQVAPQNPKVLALQTFLLMGASSPVYRFVIKPSYNIIQDAKVLRLQNKEVPPVAPSTEFTA